MATRNRLVVWEHTSTRALPPIATPSSPPRMRMAEDVPGWVGGLAPASGPPIPTVSLGVTYVMVYTYGCDDGKIAPTRCAVIDGGLGDRGSQRQAYRIPPGGARSTRSALAAVSRPASAADPGGFH